MDILQALLQALRMHARTLRPGSDLVVTAEGATRGIWSGKKQGQKYRIFNGLLSLSVVIAACTHVPVNPSDAAYVDGTARVKIVSSPNEHLLPMETRVRGLQLTFQWQSPAGYEIGEEAGSETGSETGTVTLGTDLKGRFIPTPLAPGVYSLTRIHSPGGEKRGGGKLPDLTFSIGAQQLTVREGMPSLASLGTSVASPSPAEVTLPGLSFEVKSGERHFIGDLILSYQREPFKPLAECLRREVWVTGYERSLYLFSEPIYAQLCGALFRKEAPANSVDVPEESE